ncbi:Pumilio-like protein 18 [Cardamine amara subsp. amara]|uniref:Pumilio-like protein 18 n=1 Tax=Cardamine amara subsp. amara TaxID=228776 RepID=A0ABD1B0E0_CARAN
MFNALPHLRFATDEQTPKYPKGISGSIPPPGFTTRASITHLHAALFNLMTSGEGVALFKDMISKLDKEELHRMASLLTSDSNYFTEIATNKYGSRHIQKLLGKSDDVDKLFCAAIVRCFLHIMTDKYASYVAIRAMIVFDKEKKKAMYKHILHNVLDLACDQHAFIALNEI